MTMKKIQSLYKRDYEGNRQVYDEAVPGCEWALAGEGVATLKIDGTACMYRDGIWYKRYDRKRNRKTGKHKDAPGDWIAAEKLPNEHTGHWPGWLPVDFDNPADKWHVEAINSFTECPIDGGTYELVGEKVQGNPYGYSGHRLLLHGDIVIEGHLFDLSFDSIKTYLRSCVVEGIVWWHDDGRMCKIKRRDFGFKWPPE